MEISIIVWYSKKYWTTGLVYSSQLKIGSVCHLDHRQKLIWHECGSADCLENIHESDLKGVYKLSHSRSNCNVADTISNRHQCELSTMGHIQQIFGCTVGTVLFDARLAGYILLRYLLACGSKKWICHLTSCGVLVLF